MRKSIFNTKPIFFNLRVSDYEIEVLYEALDFYTTFLEDCKNHLPMTELEKLLIQRRIRQMLRQLEKASNTADKKREIQAKNTI